MKVRVYGTLRSVVGNQKEAQVSITGPSTPRKVMDQLLVAYPDLGKKIFREGEELRGVSIFVNGRSIRFLDGLDTLLGEGDELALFPPVAGG